MDTGAAVNVLSEESYKVLKRNARRSRYPLRQSDLNLREVTGSLKILDMIILPIHLTKGIPIVRMELYVATNFQLPSYGLLELSAMKSNRIGKNPDGNSIINRGRELQAL